MTRLFELGDGSHLNSVWLEGTLIADPVEVPDEGGPSCRFAIVSPWASDSPICSAHGEVAKSIEPVFHMYVFAQLTRLASSCPAMLGNCLAS